MLLTLLADQCWLSKQFFALAVSRKCVYSCAKRTVGSRQGLWNLCLWRQWVKTKWKLIFEPVLLVSKFFLPINSGSSHSIGVKSEGLASIHKASLPLFCTLRRPPAWNHTAIWESLQLIDPVVSTAVSTRAMHHAVWLLLVCRYITFSSSHNVPPAAQAGR